MPKVLFITPGPVEWASSRLRAHWIAEGLEGAEVVEYKDIAGNRGATPRLLDTDVAIFVKVVDINMVEGLKNYSKRVFWDVCDPVHWFNPNEARAMAEAVDGIVASNHELAHDFEHWSGKKVTVIPDRIKLSHFPKQRTHQDADPVRLIWYGAGQNRFSIFGALANLERLVANGVNISLTIMDDRPHEVWQLSDKFPIYNVKWELNKENAIIAEHDIALLPDYPGAWGRVKSNNKHLTAWACGLDVTDGENYGYIRHILTDAGNRKVRKMANNLILKEEYTIDKSIDQWKDLLCA